MDGVLVFWCCSVSLEIQGYLTLRCSLKLSPRLHSIRASFCPLLSLEKGEYIGKHANILLHATRLYKRSKTSLSFLRLILNAVAGSEDANVYFYDLTRPRHTCVNKLQVYLDCLQILVRTKFWPNPNKSFGNWIIIWRKWYSLCMCVALAIWLVGVVLPDWAKNLCSRIYGFLLLLTFFFLINLLLLTTTMHIINYIHYQLSIVIAGAWLRSYRHCLEPWREFFGFLRFWWDCNCVEEIKNKLKASIFKDLDSGLIDVVNPKFIFLCNLEKQKCWIQESQWSY